MRLYPDAIVIMAECQRSSPVYVNIAADPEASDHFPNTLKAGPLFVNPIVKEVGS
jgi:hypothetical protein